MADAWATAVTGVTDVGGRTVWRGHVGAEGDAIVFLHGGLGESGAFAGMIDKLADWYDLWFYDRRGHGRTPDSSGAYSYDDMVAELVAFLAAEVRVPAHLVGHSDGANLALLAALRHPDLVRTISLFSGNLTPADVDLTGLDPLDLERELREQLGECAPGRVHETAAVVEKIVRMWSAEPQITSDELALIRRPALVACADGDIISIAHTAAIAAAVPAAELAVLPGTTHMAIVERSELCAWLVDDFIRRRGAASAALNRADAPG